jgi:tetratricopeptide (TPR) repeat protein
MFKGVSQSGAQPDIERQLKALETQADEAVPGFGAQFLNRAGDVCLEARLHRRALSYYGRAIDSYLQAGRYDAAAAVCRKLLRVSPHSVRARCTLAWLAIGKGMLGDAQKEIGDYVAGAERAARQEMAVSQLRMMSEATYHGGLLDVIAEQLERLGDALGADKVRGAALHLRELPNLHTAADEEALWEKVLNAALKGPRELLGDEKWLAE